MTACPYGDRSARCVFGAIGHKGPHDWPERHARCWYYLHAAGGPRRCTVKPDGHDGPHKYEEVPT
jgi:hypothetical protein